MSQKNIIKSILWTLFVALLLLGYIFSGIDAKKYHLKLIPSNSNGIIIIDVKEIIQEYYTLFKKDPSELLKLTTDQEINSIQNPGFNPLSKIVIYTEVYNDNILLGLIIPDAEHGHFFKTFNLKNETTLIDNTRNKHICVYQQNNAFAFIQKNVGFFIKVIHQKKPLDSAFANSYYNYLLADQKNRTVRKNNALDNIKNSKDHLAIWSNSSGFRILSLNKLFAAISTSINFEKGKLALKIDADLFDNHSFTETNNEITKLKEFELAKLSANVNQQLIESLVNEYMPLSIKSCLNEWSGEFYLSILGFRNKDVLYNDSTNISKEFNIPDIAMAFKLNNIDQLKRSILEDSTIHPIENGCYFWLKNFINEKCYLYFNDDHLLFSSTPLKNEKLSITFNTFHLNVDLERLIENYPPKDFLQKTIVSLIQQKAQFKELNIKYKGRTENTIQLDGDFYLGEEEQHKLLEFLEDIKSVPFKDLLSTFTSSSRLIVPPIKK